jgi:hypothetical protein
MYIRFWVRAALFPEQNTRLKTIHVCGIVLTNIICHEQLKYAGDCEASHGTHALLRVRENPVTATMCGVCVFKLISNAEE